VEEKAVAVVRLQPGVAGEDLAGGQEKRTLLSLAGTKGGRIRAAQRKEGDVAKGKRGLTEEQREKQRAYQRAYQAKKRAARGNISGGGKTRAVRSVSAPESSGVTLLSNGFAVTIATAGDGLSIQVRKA